MVGADGGCSQVEARLSASEAQVASLQRMLGAAEQRRQSESPGADAKQTGQADADSGTALDQKGGSAIPMSGATQGSGQALDSTSEVGNPSGALFSSHGALDAEDLRCAR